MRGADGHVTSAAELTSVHFTRGERMFPVVGVILSVQPSDDPANRTASNHVQSRGSRHECTVLASLDLGQPNILLENVIIPPLAHSGIDNLEEDLPRGVSSLVDGSQFNTDYGGLDLTTLDGEWCVVGFVGGSIGLPFIMSWWPHPINIFDLATSGNAYKQKALTQYDPKMNRGRKVWRNNGTMFLLNREGSAYLDTTQAGRKVQISQDTSSPTASQVAKGGHAQVDMKKTGQFEVNWNDKPSPGPQIGAGSSFQTTVCGEQVGSGQNCMFEPDFPHEQPLPSTSPTVPPRSTTRTIIQGKEYEFIIKTSKLVLAGQTGTGYTGEIDLLADALLKLRAGTLASVEAPQVEINAPTSLDVAAGTVLIAATGDAKVEAPKIHFDIADQFKIDSTETAITASDLLTFQGNEVEVVGLRNIVLNTKTLYLGGTESSVPAVLGDELTGLLSALLSAIQAIVIDPSTFGINTASYAVFDTLRGQLGDLLSNSVRLVP